MKVPDIVGVPLMVILLEAQVAVTPVGKPVAVPMPVAPVVVCVIYGFSAVLTHSVGAEEAAPAVLSAITCIIPVALTLPQPPVRGIL